MASKTLCDPCAFGNKSSSALKYCSECEEKLCQECADSHLRFKAFQFHHVIDLSVVDSRLPPASSNYCETHPDYQLDLFCNFHDTVCCCACVLVIHNNCKDVLPIKAASKDVKTSSLLSDSLKIVSDLSVAINALSKNRESNRKSLVQSKQSINNQIRDFKVNLLKEIDKMEQKIIVDLNLSYHQNERKISKEEEQLSVLSGLLKEREEQLNFLKDHGSDRQLFITLRHIIKENQQTETKIKDLTSDMKEINIKFDQSEDLKIESFGSIVEINEPCNVEYKGSHPELAQVQHVQNKPLTEFQLESNVELRSGIKYNIKGIAVTADNILLICNDHFSNAKVHVYRDCDTYEKEIGCSGSPFGIALIPNLDKAVVSLPIEKTIQFINTRNCTAGELINVKKSCYGLAASTNKIFLGGQGFVLILGHDGSEISKLTTSFIPNYFNPFNDLYYNESKNQLILRYSGVLHCVTEEVEEVYRYDTSGSCGVTVDREGNAYTCCYDRNEIHRLSPDGQFRDIVLNTNKGIDKPSKITFNHNFSMLIAVNKCGKSISVYSCK